MENYNEQVSVLLSRKAYDIIEGKANSNSLIQGVSGVLGFPFTLMADGAVIFTHYGTMLNEIRRLYNRSTLNEEVIITIIKGIKEEILFDIVADKVLGQIPLVGIYFNAICAKAMTWRLGILFSMLSSRGEAINEQKVREATKLVRMLFPQNDSFKFKQPSYPTFEKLVVSVYENAEDEYNNKIGRALDAFN